MYKNKQPKDRNIKQCDYCGKTVNTKKYTGDGGRVKIPFTLTGTIDIELVLHTKCLKPQLERFDKKREIRRKQNM